MTELTTLVLNFSEQLNSSTAQNINNYSINNGISVSNASLSATEVTLTTSAHESGAYTVTVNNVTDLSGNIIDPEHNSASNYPHPSN
ncbi:MAG: Ig-like domain-containing protein [Saprospiraceae bacterium]|nr:Ig-like domain-containing protein [Saprospiraceae bacterium]